jgi:hypothetical protein
MKRLLIGIAVLCTTAIAHAQGGYVVTGATITHVTNTSGNAAAFSITVSGGTGSCAGSTITFLQTAAPDADTFKRAYVAALMALSVGLHVTVYNYTDTTCNLASYIDVYQ